MKYLLPLSAWFAYIGYGVYVYFTSDGTLIDTLAGLFMGLFSPFWWLPTGVLALVALCLMASILATTWRYKWQIFALLQWLYVGLIYVAVMALTSV